MSVLEYDEALSKLDMLEAKARSGGRKKACCPQRGRPVVCAGEIGDSARRGNISGT